MANNRKPAVCMGLAACKGAGQSGCYGAGRGRPTVGIHVGKATRHGAINAALLADGAMRRSEHRTMQRRECIPRARRFKRVDDRIGQQCARRRIVPKTTKQGYNKHGESIRHARTHSHSTSLHWIINQGNFDPPSGHKSGAPRSSHL